ncbi:MAG: tetratricopeptide repeat protein [Acidobacteriota bacterium]
MRAVTPKIFLLVLTLFPLIGCGTSGAAGGGVSAQVDFGVDMARRGLWSEALFRFQQAERLEPNNFRVMNNLAVAYEANGLFDEALEAYQKALGASPNNRELRRNYSRFVEFYQSFRPDDEDDSEGSAAANEGGG